MLRAGIRCVGKVK